MNTSQSALNRAHITDIVEFDGTVTVTVVCPFDSSTNTVTAPADGLNAWAKGAFIQDALPDLTDTERELLMTGMCDNCWDGLFGDDE